LIILLLRYLIFSHLFFPLYLNWSFRKWVFRSIWLLPIVRAAVPVHFNSPPRVKIPKIFDRGVLRNPVIFLGNTFGLRRLTFISFVNAYKIIILLLTWATIAVLYYLCNIYKKLCLLMLP
jgi:hypothetical protein